MRLPLLALLCMGTAAFAGRAAFCQSPGPQKMDPDKLFEMPKQFSGQPPELGKLEPQPFLWNGSMLAHPTIDIPRPGLNSPQIDPKIIVHPPWHGASKGQDVAHRQYPGLKFLPLHHNARTPK